MYFWGQPRIYIYGVRFPKGSWGAVGSLSDLNGDRGNIRRSPLVFSFGGLAMTTRTRPRAALSLRWRC